MGKMTCDLFHTKNVMGIGQNKNHLTGIVGSKMGKYGPGYHHHGYIDSFPEIYPSHAKHDRKRVL